MIYLALMHFNVSNSALEKSVLSSQSARERFSSTDKKKKKKHIKMRSEKCAEPCVRSSPHTEVHAHTNTHKRTKAHSEINRWERTI